MKEFNIDRVNAKKIMLGEQPLKLVKTNYNDLKIEDGYLVDRDGWRIGTKGDMYHKLIMDKILQEGCLDHDPRPHYEDFYEGAKIINPTTIETKDGEEIYIDETAKIIEKDEGIEVHSKAHTLSINDGVECTYDLSKGESPMITLRPIAIKTMIAEILWIYQKQSNDLVEFDEMLGMNTWDKDHKINNWWKDWPAKDKDGIILLNELGHPIIGSCYGGTTSPRNMIYEEVIDQIRKNRDGRRNITCLWQIDDFKQPHGLKPCAFLTIWNVRHEWDGTDYLDMTMVQRSSDFATAGCINQAQYVALQKMVAKELQIRAGKFTWKPVNVQLYDRHINQAITMLNREPVACDATIKLNGNKNKFTEFTKDDTYIDDYPKHLIKAKNPQLKFQLGI